MENQIANNQSVQQSINNQPNYLDNNQEISFYVQNISNGEVILADIGVKVPLLGCVDLREHKDIDVIKKSSSVRQALSPKINWLKRIDHDQYIKLLSLQQKREDRIANQKKGIAERKQSEALKESGNNGNPLPIQKEVQIRPQVLSMVEKYKLFHKGTSTTFGPEDLHLFVESQPLNDDETGYLLGIVKEKDIRDTIIAKSPVNK